MISLLEPIDRVNPAVHDRPSGKRRQGRRFPPIGDDETKDGPESRREPEESPTPEPERRDESDDDHEGHIDITVAGRSLPTRHVFPSATPSATLH